MKQYFAYIRVSTAKQGQHGSSLQEQRDAILAFCHRHDLIISEWFEDRETAAKAGRTQFMRMMLLLEKQKAAGLILHKIDRGARNLWDWARLQELIDGGIDVRFAHEDLDLRSRGGRLAADIQAVVAADYVRNLREEVIKGQRGRLKQGLFPFGAVLGYLNNGRGKPKTIDPVRGPLVRQAFELYASGKFSFDGLRHELRRRGLFRSDGKALSRCSLTSMLRNSFYAGVIRVRATGETFAGIHEPLINVHLFHAVQDVLDGKITKGPRTHSFLYRQMFSCGECGRSLVGERQKGHVYYRCHDRDCSTTGVREEAISAAVAQAFARLRFSAEELGQLRPFIESENKSAEDLRTARVKAVAIRVAALQEREARLTDMFLDGMLDREAYRSRQASLAFELAKAKQEHAQILRQTPPADDIAERLATIGRLDWRDMAAHPDHLRAMLKSASSNRKLIAKKPCIELQWPLEDLCKELNVLRCAPSSVTCRTFPDYRALARVLIEYLKDWTPPEELLSPPERKLPRYDHLLRQPRAEEEKPSAH